MAKHPYVPVNHKTSAAASVVLCVGLFLNVLSQTAPDLQRVFPAAHWIAPVIMFLGAAASAWQKLGIADHQATIAAAQKGS